MIETYVPIKYTSEQLFEMIKTLGIEQTLTYIDIENITDHTTKVICRTIKTSMETLMGTLVNSVKTEDVPQQ